VRRLPPVVLTAALLFTACSPQALPSTTEVAPSPSASASPLLEPSKTSDLRPSRTRPTTKAATPPVPRVPVTDTDPSRLLPAPTTVPARLEVGKLDISMEVVPVGVDPRGDMELPASVAQVGWYEFGSRPADAAGATVLAAHVDSKKEGLGPFARLRTVREGANVVLTTKDGTVHRYRVTAVEVLPKTTVPLAQVFQRDGAPRLTMVTCGGAYDQGTGYSANVVVTAEPLSTVKS